MSNRISRGKIYGGQIIPDKLNIVTLNLAAGHADQTLTTEQMKQSLIFLTGAADQGFNIIFNVAYKNFYIIVNASGQIATLKNAAGATTTVADGAIAMAQNNGTDMIALTGQTGTQATLTGTQTMTNKTLTTPIAASIYQDAGKTKLMTMPNTASDTIAVLDALQTFTNKSIDSATNPLKNVVLAYAASITRAEMVAGKTLIADVAGRTIKVLSIKLGVVGAFNGGAGTSMIIQDSGTPVVILTVLKAALTDGAKISTSGLAIANVTEGAGMTGALTAAKGIVVVADAAWDAGTNVNIVIQYMYV